MPDAAHHGTRALSLDDMTAQFDEGSFHFMPFCVAEPDSEARRYLRDTAQNVKGLAQMFLVVRHERSIRIDGCCETNIVGRPGPS